MSDRSIALARCIVALALLVGVPTRTTNAQSADLTGDFASAIVVSDLTNSYNNPIYAASVVSGSNYSGIAVLWFYSSGGTLLSGCTGSNLGGGRILTAAHCVSNGTSLTSASVKARFYQVGSGWVEVTGPASGYVVKPGYSGGVVEENDVAVLKLSSSAPSFARSYSLAAGNALGATEIFAGYGRTGTGNTGGTVSTIFTSNPPLRTGLNMFETTCISGSSITCATSSNSAFGEFGGILLSDFDHTGASDAGFMCTTLHFCGLGYSGNEEVTIGSGDSGGASFLSDFSITGVASFGQTNGSGIGGFFGYVEGHTCVTYYEANGGCTSNYEFVAEQLAPEPATIVLLGTGLITAFGFARRRRRGA
ncbi:MAG: trypsin-like serine protease [Gemmatimonadota bacterium]